jgi:hypothetical protein
LQVVRGGFPPDDAPTHGDEEAKDFTVKGVVVPLALGENPSGLARPAIADADLRVELVHILGGGITGESEDLPRPEAVE